MMTTAASAGDVLAAFKEACPSPTPADLAAWIVAHPRHAGELRDLAATLLEARLLAGDAKGDEPSEAEVEAEVALALGRARRVDEPTLREVIDGAGLDLPTVAERIGIDVDVVAALEEGAVSSPVPALLVRRMADVVPFPARAMRAAIDASRHRPAFALAAKMPAGAAFASRTWAEIIDASDMSDARKAFWREAE